MINTLDKWKLARGNRICSVRTNDMVRTRREVSIEGLKLSISQLPSALIINHQSVLNFHLTPAVSGVYKGRPETGVVI